MIKGIYHFLLLNISQQKLSIDCISKRFEVIKEQGPTSYVYGEFLQQHTNLQCKLWRILDDLYTNPSRSPNAPGKGIALTADSVFGNNPQINIHRLSYVRQNFGRNKITSSHNKDTVMRATYGTGSGLNTHGTPVG